MTRWVALLLLAPGPLLAADPIRAEVLEDPLRVRVAAPLPEGAILTVRVLRDSRPSPVEILFLLLPLGPGGRGEFPLDLKGETGRLRVQVRYEPSLQYPHVLDRAAGAKPEPVEVRLRDDSASPDFLRSILEEERRLAEAMAEVGAFLDRVQALEAEKAVGDWDAWRPGAVERLEGFIRHARALKGRLFPETHSAFTQHFLAQGVLPWEQGRRLLAGGAKEAWHEGSLAGKEKVSREDLAPLRSILGRESLEYRLTVLKAVVTEARSGRQARKRWDAVLALIGPEDPAAPAAKCLTEWLDDPSDARKAALEAAYRDLESRLPPP